MDNIDPLRRSHNMRQIRAKNTMSELQIRRIVWRLGYAGYRLYRADLPGKPDLAWLKKKKAIFINGCFWHGHSCKEGRRKPKSNVDYWIPKIQRNIDRDRINVKQLKKLGWQVLVVWECQLIDNVQLTRKINKFFSDAGNKA